MASNSSPSSSEKPTSLPSSPSLKLKGLERLKSLKKLGPACFHVPYLDPDEHHAPVMDRSLRENRTPKLERLKSSSERAKNFLSKFGSRRHHHHRRRYSSGELKYDATSYALNFDDGDMENDATPEEFLRRNFSAPPRCS